MDFFLDLEEQSQGQLHVFCKVQL